MSAKISSQTQFSQLGRNRRTAFTLIEVLVVVAIIALLAAILLPSLSRAREQAQIAMCKANGDQIGKMVAMYQSEFKGYLPVVFYVGAGPVYDVPARTTLLSLALRRYNKELVNLHKIQAADGTYYIPDTIWPSEKHQYYRTKMAPDHHICPFGRDKGDVTSVSRPLTPPLRDYNKIQERNGRLESYVTWLWEGDTVRNLAPIRAGEAIFYPTDPREGRPQYSTLSFNFATATSILNNAAADEERHNLIPPGAEILHDAKRDPATGINVLSFKHRQWKARDAHRLRSGSLSELTIAYCSMGKFMALSKSIVNPNSHRTSIGGGTNAVFADSHVEWVRGTRIGWP
ncbi:MAG: prepilin-type N-terminal cleavage/methylation domain-containing protein [Planctomycetota bacterium]|nr:MAG: prepilin-type N-terminal cleavage/methylation domain-containing protein [Planctomycetota bacterium]